MCPSVLNIKPSLFEGETMSFLIHKYSTLFQCDIVQVKVIANQTRFKS